MCEDNVELDSKGTGWEGVDWILLVRQRDVAASSKRGFYKTWEMCGLTKYMVCAQDILALL